MRHKFFPLFRALGTASRRALPAVTITAMLVLLASSTGCGQSGPPSGMVEGTVTLEGSSLAGAYVNFFNSESGAGGGAPIGADGKFAFEAPLRVGQYAVTIVPPSAPPPLPVEDAAPEVKPPTIPKKYQSETTSELTADVKEGRNTFDFALD